MAKLSAIQPDVAVLDLEDGLDSRDLQAARERISETFNAKTVPPIRLAVRTHRVGTTEFLADTATFGPTLTALLLPKVASPEEVLEAGSLLEARGLDHVKIVPMIESAEGLRNAFEILTAHPAVNGVALGGEDLAADLGLPFPVDADPRIAEGRKRLLDSARSQLILEAAAASVPWRIASPDLNLADAAAVENAAVVARAHGFTGMLAVHPTQVEALASGFRPTRPELDRAREILTASTQDGAHAHQGRMVDEALLRQARNTLEGLDE